MQKFKLIKGCSLWILFFFILLFPVIGGKLDSKFVFNGVSAETELTPMNLKGIMDGRCQEEWNTVLNSKVPGRNLLIRVHNQVLYSLFDVSANPNIVIGKNKYLYEPAYLQYSFNMQGRHTEDEIAQLADKLQNLHDLLKENNKELYVFITPSKARYYAEEAPFYYKLCAGNSEEELLYDTFVRLMKNTDVNVYDSIAFINANRDTFDFPLYYATGIHWSNALGNTVAEDFNKYLCQTSRYDLGQIKVEVEANQSCIYPDADLFNTLNLLEQPKDNYYAALVNLEKEGKDTPNVFLRGGSFMGQSLNQLIKADVFGKDIHFENSYYFTDNYSSQQILSNYNAYEEIDLQKYLSESDVLILEVNEIQVRLMCWGFIDYVLEHPELLKGE